MWLGSRKNSSVKYMEHLGITWNPPQIKILGIWFTNSLVNCFEINYTDKLYEIRKLFQIWSKRQITPLGRIAILKSLILSKLVHLWLLLPNPPDKTIVELQKMSFSFVWNNKMDKINRKLAVKPLQEGGMGIPDINSFIRALKLTWIRKLRSTKHKWKNLAAVELKHIEKIDFFGPEFLVLKNITNTFWENVIKAYKEFYYKVELKHCGELLAEPVCYNKNIKLGNDIIRKHNWQEKRVYCIAHFLHDDGSFLRREEFNGKYGLNENFLFYAGVLKTIGKFIKSTKIAMTGNIAQAINAPMEKIVSVNKGAKIYYEMLIKNNLVPKCCEKWNSKVNYNINWKICFKKIKKINDINTKWFQMRIIHRIIATNITLKEMKVSENVLCGFCREYFSFVLAL